VATLADYTQPMVTVAGSPERRLPRNCRRAERPCRARRHCRRC